MNCRSLPLLTALLLLAFLPGCGTDTKTTENLGASAGQAHYGGVWFGSENPANRAQYLGYSLKGTVNVGGTGNTTGNPPVTSPSPDYTTVDYSITCLSCHPNGDTSVNSQILKEYAATGHADVTAIPWTRPVVGGTCQRCHSTFGFIHHLKNYSDPAAPYLGISLSSPDILPQWTGTILSTPLKQEEEYKNAIQVLICSACHLEGGLVTGTLRTSDFPGGYVANWTQNDVTALVSFPDAGASNLCIRCHSARRAGLNITSTATTTAHNLPVAAMVFSGTSDLANITATTSGGPAVNDKFTGVAYEFSEKRFSEKGYVTPVPSHKNVGGPGGKGPCVGCHMSGSVGHSLKVVSKDEGGNITTINGSSACLGCHGTVLPAWLNGKKAGFNSAVKELEELLQDKGFFFDSEDGTFYRDADSTPLGTGATSVERNAAIKKYYDDQADSLGLDRAYLRGAAYNLWLLSSRSGDRAAYVHNSNYTKKVLFDTLDYLDNGDFDGDLSFLSATAAAYLDGDSEADGLQRP